MLQSNNDYTVKRGIYFVQYVTIQLLEVHEKTRENTQKTQDSVTWINHVSHFNVIIIIPEATWCCIQPVSRMLYFISKKNPKMCLCILYVLVSC